MKQKKSKGFGSGFVKRVKIFAFAILAFLGGAWLCRDMCSASGTIVALATVPLITKIKKEGMSEDEEKFLDYFIDCVNKSFESWAGWLITKDSLEENIKVLKDEMLEALSAKMITSQQLNEVNEIIKGLGDEVKSMKEKGFNLQPGSELTKALDEVIDSQKFKDFRDGIAGKRSGKITLELKDIVSLANNYRGNILTTQQSNRVVVDVNERRINMRDLLTVEQGDPNFTSLTFATITELDRNAASVSENGRLPESSFKLKEVTSGLSRIGTFVNISKRLLKSRIYLRSFLLNRLPKWVLMAEDFQILFGDGQGDNLLGLAKNSFNVVDWLTKNVASGVAGDVADVSSYDDGKATLIRFSKPFPKLEEGMLITFASAPAGSKLAEENIMHKYNDREIMIEVPFVSISEEETRALTFTAKNNFFNQVIDPTIADAINAGIAILTYGEFTPNVVALNPSDVFRIETEKDTTGRSLGLVTTNNGVKYISGRAIVETTAIAPGYYFMGDLRNGTSLVDYTTLTVEFAEDCNTKLQNYVTVIAQEEVMLPIYNKFAFSYGKLSELQNAIKAPEVA